MFYDRNESKVNFKIVPKIECMCVCVCEGGCVFLNFSIS